MDEIMTTGQNWATAESTGDTGALADLVTDDFRVVGPVGFILDRQQYLGRYQGGFSPESVAWDDVIVRDYGNAAVTIATVTQQASFQNQRADGQFRVAPAGDQPGRLHPVEVVAQRRAADPDRLGQLALAAGGPYRQRQQDQPDRQRAAGRAESLVERPADGAAGPGQDEPDRLVRHHSRIVAKR